jgi:hypothetical protein
MDDSLDLLSPQDVARVIDSMYEEEKDPPVFIRKQLLELARHLHTEEDGVVRESLLKGGPNDDKILCQIIIELLRCPETEMTPPNHIVDMCCSSLFSSCVASSVEEEEEISIDVRNASYVNECGKVIHALGEDMLRVNMDWRMLSVELNYFCDDARTVHPSNGRSRVQHLLSYNDDDTDDKRRYVIPFLLRGNLHNIGDILSAFLGSVPVLDDVTLETELVRHLTVTINSIEGGGGGSTSSSASTIREILANVYDRTLTLQNKSVPWSPYNNMKKILTVVLNMTDGEDKTRVSQMLYSAQTKNDCLLANQMLLAAYLYEPTDSWIYDACKFIDVEWVNIRSLASILLSMSEAETEVVKEQRSQLAFSLMNYARGGVLLNTDVDSASAENARKLSTVVTALNKEIDRRMARPRDLNLFFLPSPVTGSNVVSRYCKTALLATLYSNKKHYGDALSHIVIDSSFIQLEPRAQEILEPKSLAKLVSPHKLKQEVENTERANNIVIPKVKCFHCVNGWIQRTSSRAISRGSVNDFSDLIAPDPAAHLKKAWYYSREYTQLEFASTSDGAMLRPVHKNDPTWPSAKESPSKRNTTQGKYDDDAYKQFDDAMCKVLEQAYSDGSTTVMCRLRFQDVAVGIPLPTRNKATNKRFEETENRSVEIEVDLKKMTITDRMNKTERWIYRADRIKRPTRRHTSRPPHEPTGQFTPRSPAATPAMGRLSLDNPEGSKQGDGERIKCWVCFGTGVISRWFSEEVANIAGSPSMSMKRRISANDCEGSSLDEHMPECPICYCDPGIYGLSVQCDHLFCKDCAASSLQAMLESGQFPANCPMCRAEGKIPDPEGHDTEPCGRITRPVLTFLCERDVINKKFQFRFVNAMRRFNNTYLKSDSKDQFMHCPRKGCECYVYCPVIDDDAETSEGQTPCGQIVCLLCHEGITELKPPERDPKTREIIFRKHDCAKLEAKKKMKEAADKKAMDKDMALLATFGKKCPACSMFIEKNEGCDVMFCGDTAHGNLRKAIINGGCGIAFDWGNLKVRDDDFTDLDGGRKRGLCVTARMVPHHPKCAREGCNYYMCTDGVKTDLVKSAMNTGSGGGQYCCANCKNGGNGNHKAHSDLCHKIVHPQFENMGSTAAAAVVKFGDNCVKWLQPFDAQLVKIEFNAVNQFKLEKGNLDSLLAAMCPSHFQLGANRKGYQFGMEVIGVDGRPLIAKDIFTENVFVSRQHGSLTPAKPAIPLDLDANPLNRLSTINNMDKDNGDSVFPKNSAMSFSIIFDFGKPVRVVGLRSVLMSSHVVKLSYAGISAAETIYMKSYFSTYEVAQHTYVHDKSIVMVKGEEKAAADAAAAADMKEEEAGSAAKPPPPPAKQGKSKVVEDDNHVPYNEEEQRAARRREYDLMKGERENIMAIFGGNACECPACGTIIVKDGGDDTMMCGCEAGPAGGTVAKALAGGGCALQFNFKTKKPLGNGKPGEPFNDRQWRYAKG